jgi:hypothetical protein
MSFSARWNRKVVATGPRALQGTVPDARHTMLHPHDKEYSDNPTMPDSWVSRTANPGTVGGIEGEDTLFVTPQSVAGGPVDYTPVDHTTGDGVGAGLTPEESQEQNASWRGVDYNAGAARRWTAPGDVDYANVAERLQEEFPVSPMGSPETVALHVGTNRESYPNTSTGHRIHRWRERVMMRIQWQTDHRPAYVPNAYAAVPRGPGNDYLVSPYPSMGTVHTLREQAPQLRRPPQSWGAAVTTDGMSTPSVLSDPPPDVWGM